jgi:oligopeptide/dipeptide ABC transporter ATP-binding protein
MKDTLLEVKNLSIGIRKNGKLYGAVEDINFVIKSGEIAGIVGESGCGKTLSALAIGGLLGRGTEVSSGKIIFSAGGNTRDLLALSERDLADIRGRDISVIFQESFSSLNPLLKIGYQAGEALACHGEKDKGKIKKSITELFENLALKDPEKLMENYPHRLSGGMCQRVTIAMALISKPALLIADEPTTALDQSLQEDVLETLKKINTESGTGILFISHDLSLINRLCRKVMVMYAGRIVEEGNAEEVFHRPGHEYTKGLLGAIPTRDMKGKPLANIPGRVPSIEEGRPEGCPFAPRCAKAREQCRASFPRGRILSESHKAYCLEAENS